MFGYLLHCSPSTSGAFIVQSTSCMSVRPGFIPSLTSTSVERISTKGNIYLPTKQSISPNSLTAALRPTIDPQKSEFHSVLATSLASDETLMLQLKHADSYKIFLPELDSHDILWSFDQKHSGTIALVAVIAIAIVANDQTLSS